MKQVKHYLSYFEHTVKNQWNDAALTDLDSNTHYTYGQLAEQIAHLHLTFQNLGIKPGDKIAIASRNCSNWVVSYMAIMSYKAVAVTLLQPCAMLANGPP